jgi:hypothetical protein
MQKLNLEKWSKDPELEGLLFFAQAVYDMLFDYTLDSYKVPALNTHSRCLEGLVFTDMVSRGLIPQKYQKSLDPIIAEFLWSFKNDQIIKGLFGKKKEYYVREVESRKDKSKELKNILNLIADLLSLNYLEEVKKQLRTAICEEPNKKDLIYSLTCSFLPELIYSGYSKGFIFYKTKSFFFDPGIPPEINSPEQLDEFLNEFDLEEKEFNLIFKANEDFKYIIEPPPEAPKPRTSRGYEKDFFEERSEDYPFIIEFKGIKAFDAHSARGIAEDRIRVWASLLKYKIHTRDFSWQNKVLIYEPHDHPLVMDPPTKAVHKKPDIKLDEFLKETKKILELFEGNLDEESVAIIMGALKLHSEAISAKTEENQLLTFWSSIEGILTPPGDVGRINYILRSIKPLLVFDYPKKLIFDIQKNLEKLGGPEVMEIIDKVEGDNLFEKCAAIISIKENETFRDDIYSLLQDKGDVLMKNRLYKLMQKLKSAENIKSTIEEHRQRVVWHVQRIYRMRNMIAHSMVRLPPYYLDTLIENLHAYVDRILELLLTTSKDNPNIETIEGIILKISLDVDTHLNILKTHKEEYCKPENYMLYLLGPK